MNRTALSVVALAVGSVLIIALFNVYKPAVSHLSHDVFDKVHIGRMAGTQPTRPDKPWNTSKYTASSENERAYDWWCDITSSESSFAYDDDPMGLGPNELTFNKGDYASKQDYNFTKPYKSEFGIGGTIMFFKNSDPHSKITKDTAAPADVNKPFYPAYGKNSILTQ